MGKDLRLHAIDVLGSAKAVLPRFYPRTLKGDPNDAHDFDSTLN